MKNKDAVINLTFKFESKRRDITAHSTEAFFNSSIPKSLNNIILFLYVNEDKKQEIWICLDFSIISCSSVTVKGIDSTWVNGIATKIEDLFENNKTYNGIFNNYVTRIPITIAIAGMLGFAVAFLDLSYLHDLWDDEIFYEHIRGLSIIIAFILYWTIGWLFPKIEFEDYLLQTKIRKRVLTMLVLIIVGFIVAGLPKLFL